MLLLPELRYTHICDYCIKLHAGALGSTNQESLFITSTSNSAGFNDSGLRLLLQPSTLSLRIIQVRRKSLSRCVWRGRDPGELLQSKINRYSVLDGVSIIKDLLVRSRHHCALQRSILEPSWRSSMSNLTYASKCRSSHQLLKASASKRSRSYNAGRCDWLLNAMAGCIHRQQ